jgi:hypothetical protein
MRRDDDTFASTAERDRALRLVLTRAATLRRRRRWVAGGAIAVVLAAAVVAAVLSTARPTRSTRVVTHPPASLPASFSTPVPGVTADAVAATEQDIWVGRALPNGTGLVERLDPPSLSVRARVAVAHPVTHLAVGLGRVWAVGYGGSPARGGVTAIDVTTNQISGELSFPAATTEPSGVAVGSGGVWITDSRGSLLNLTTTSPLRVAVRVPMEANPVSVTVQGNQLWVGSPQGVWLVDAQTLQARRTLVAGTSVAVGTRYLWASFANGGQADTYTINPAAVFTGTSAAEGIRAHGQGRSIGGGLAPEGDGVWVAENTDVVYLRPNANRLAAIVAGSQLNGIVPEQIAVADGTVWIAQLARPLLRYQPVLPYDDCPRAVSPRAAAPDALPHQGDANLANVQRVLNARDQPSLPLGASSIDIAPRLGETWMSQGGKTIVVAPAPPGDYRIVAHLTNPAQCPNKPVSWDGVPISFTVDH